jgi:hypothetical protein
MNCPKCQSTDFNQDYGHCWTCHWQDTGALWRRLGVAAALLKDLVRLADATSEVDLHLRRIRYQQAQEYVDQEEKYSEETNAHLRKR